MFFYLSIRLTAAAIVLFLIDAGKTEQRKGFAVAAGGIPALAFLSQPAMSFLYNLDGSVWY